MSTQSTTILVAVIGAVGTLAGILLKHYLDSDRSGVRLWRFLAIVSTFVLCGFILTKWVMGDDWWYDFPHPFNVIGGAVMFLSLVGTIVFWSAATKKNDK